MLGCSDWLKKTEKFTHSTKKNHLPKYDLDVQFPAYPSGLRRAALRGRRIDRHDLASHQRLRRSLEHHALMTPLFRSAFQRAKYGKI
jgi:hypothetical protein